MTRFETQIVKMASGELSHDSRHNFNQNGRKHSAQSQRVTDVASRQSMDQLVLGLP